MPLDLPCSSAKLTQTWISSGNRGAEQKQRTGFSTTRNGVRETGAGISGWAKNKASRSTTRRWRVDKLSTGRSAREVKPLHPKLGSLPYSWLKRSTQ